jgi:ATP-binding cassette subfamily B protein
MDCGPTCLRMIAKYYGRDVSREFLRTRTNYGREGTSLLGLSEAAEVLGFKSIGIKLTFDQLLNDVPLPAIIHWNEYHFVVLTPEATSSGLLIADPAKGYTKFNREEFLKQWLPKGDRQVKKGTVLLLEPSPIFEQLKATSDGEETHSLIDSRYLLSYVRKYKIYFSQILLGVLIGSILQLLFPYLTQSIVDKGINNRDITFITIVLLGQLVLLFSQTIIEFIRRRILLYISTKINLSLLSGFWSKLLKLPLQFFDTKHPGDIMQRISDHQRIESFLTGTALNTLFSLVSLVIFSIVLFSYSSTVFLVFSFGSIAYLLWIRFFLQARRKLDFQKFSLASKETSASMQLVYGMQEIKLNNAENTYRWAWESLQANLFNLNFKSLSLTQYQQIGAFFINQGKNIIITFLVARLVTEGALSLGVMLAIQYIIGQLNGPIEQIIGFTQQAQDAKMSLERLNDIHALAEEEPLEQSFNYHLPEQKTISLNNVSFSYPGTENEFALSDITLTIPEGKTTAIVGMSGSGKSTLLKLLLKFYTNYEGSIYIGGNDFKTISPKYWRSISGAVMQDSFIFNDNIRNNIAVTTENIDEAKLIEACRAANILSSIEGMSLGFNTRLGAAGIKLSGGQKQRLSIARAIYKNPEFVFFDEATNSLDTNNERIIINNLQHFFTNRTVVVIAHRLSTVRNADKIVVLADGKLVEEGTHEQLVLLRGHYFQLIKNQLEIDN